MNILLVAEALTQSGTTRLLSYSPSIKDAFIRIFTTPTLFTMISMTFIAIHIILLTKLKPNLKYLYMTIAIIILCATPWEYEKAHYYTNYYAGGFCPPIKATKRLNGYFMLPSAQIDVPGRTPYIWPSRLRTQLSSDADL